jgi:hypothetical protein
MRFFILSREIFRFYQIIYRTPVLRLATSAYWYYLLSLTGQACSLAHIDRLTAHYLLASLIAIVPLDIINITYFKGLVKRFLKLFSDYFTPTINSQGMAQVSAPF